MMIRNKFMMVYNESGASDFESLDEDGVYLF